jgi:Pre-toxin TG
MARLIQRNASEVAAVSAAIPSTPVRPPVSRPSAGVQRRHDPAVDWFVDHTIEELDDDAREKVLLSLILNVMKLDGLHQWGLALAEHPDHTEGNYLLKFFKKTWNQHVFERDGIWDIFIEKLADQGVMVRKLELAWELHLLDIAQQSKPLQVDIRQYPGVAWKAAVGDLLKPFVELFDQVIHLLPVVGEVLGAIEALSGRELLTGEKLTGWQRFLGALPLAPELARAPRAVARMISAYSRETRVAESLLVRLVSSTERLSHYESQLRGIQHVVEESAHLPRAERPLLTAADQHVLAEAHDSLAPLAAEAEGLPGEIDKAFADLEAGNIPQGDPAVRVQVRKSGQAAQVGDIGAGPKKVDLGIPPERELVAVERMDKTAAGSPDQILDASGPFPPKLYGKYDTLIINNPYKYAPNIAELSKGLTPNGKIILQGNWKANSYFRHAADPARIPPGMTVTVERNVQPLGRGFSYTDASRPGAPVVDSRITIEFKH